MTEHSKYYYDKDRNKISQGDLVYFKKSEFQCNCVSCKEKGDTGENMDMSFLRLLDRARQLTGGIPMKINSGYRCPTHNKNVGGVKNSSHKNIPCNAADISTKDSKTRYAILNALIQVGATRIGIGETFIHVDTDTKEKSPKVIWTYY